MNWARIFPKSNLPANRWFHVWLAMMLVFWLFQPNLYWFFQPDPGPYRGRAFVFWLIIILFHACLWVAFTAVRLADLCLSRFWIAPILIPLGAATSAQFMGRPNLVAFAGIIFVTVQLPLMGLSPRKRLESSSVEGPRVRQP